MKPSVSNPVYVLSSLYDHKIYDVITAIPKEPINRFKNSAELSPGLRFGAFLSQTFKVESL